MFGLWISVGCGGQTMSHYQTRFWYINPFLQWRSVPVSLMFIPHLQTLNRRPQQGEVRKAVVTEPGLTWLSVPFSYLFPRGSLEGCWPGTSVTQGKGIRLHQGQGTVGSGYFWQNTLKGGEPGQAEE